MESTKPPAPWHWANEVLQHTNAVGVVHTRVIRVRKPGPGIVATVRKDGNVIHTI